MAKSLCPARVVASGLPFNLECTREKLHVGAHKDPRYGSWLHKTEPKVGLPKKPKRVIVRRRQ